MLKVELYSFTPSEFIITTLNHLTTHFPIYTFEMIKFQSGKIGACCYSI